MNVHPNVGNFFSLKEGNKPTIQGFEMCLDIIEAYEVKDIKNALFWRVWLSFTLAPVNW